MGSHVRWDCVLKGMDLFVGIVAVFILIGVALEIYAMQFPRQTGFAGALLILYFASWIGFAGIACLSLLLAWALVRARTSCL